MFDSIKCKSYQKICEEAENEHECKLIEKTGVSNPDRICAFDATTQKCFENYKYCSDFRENNPTFCSQIKPYDSTGENLDTIYKCVDESDGVGWKKKLLDCSVAQKDAAFCESISAKLKESTNNKKYCRFINGPCQEDYWTCGSYDEETFVDADCTNIKPNNYLIYKCEVDTNADGNKICKEVEEKNCDNYGAKYDSTHYQNLCINIKSYCSYEATGNMCTKTYCSTKSFSTPDDSNQNVCKILAVSDSKKICVLNSAKTACEEIDNPEIKELTEAIISPPTQKEEETQKETQKNNSDEEAIDTSAETQAENNPSQGNNGSSKIKGIQSVIILLYLLLI